MSQDPSSELPEGVIDAEAAGGWEGGAVGDGETRERSDAEAAEVTQGIDPDIATDDDVEQGS